MIKIILYSTLFTIFLSMTQVSIAEANDPTRTLRLSPPNRQILWNSNNSDIQSFKSSKFEALPLELRHSNLSLTQLTSFALAHNPQTELAWAQIEFSAAQLGSAENVNWPHINDTVNIFEIKGNSKNNNVGMNYSNNLSINYLLWDFGQSRHRIAAARYNVIAADFSQNAIIQQIILQVEQNYYGVLGQQALLKAEQDNIISAKTNLKAAEVLHQQGMATIGDIAQAQSALSQAELTLQQTRGDLADAEGELATTLGLPVQTTLSLQPLDLHIPLTKISKNIGNFLDAAQHRRPDLLAAGARVAAAENQLSAARVQGWPTVQLNVSNGETRLVGVPSSSQTQIGVSVSIPIFNGFSHTYAVQQAKASLDEATAQQNILSNDVALQVWQSYYALQTTAASISNTQQLLKSSQLAAKQALGQYRAGVGNILAVLSTQATAANANVQQIQALLNWYMALAQLSASMGNIRL